MRPSARIYLPLAILVAISAAIVLHASTLGVTPTTTRVSVSSNGTEGFSASQTASVSDDGRYVAFSSDAATLVPNDTNSRDTFVHDRETGMTELVSKSSSGEQANRPTAFPAISGNGRYVVFESEAFNLVPNDTNEVSDVFRYDRDTDTLERVNLTNSGTEATGGGSFTPSISDDGRYVTFSSEAEDLVEDADNGDRDVFIRDLQLGTTELVSVATDGTLGDGPSGGLGAGPGRVTPDGRFVVYGSFASSLAPNDENLRDDVFVRDRQAGITERVSVSSDGVEGGSHSLYGDISDDGRLVVFHSGSALLVPNDDNDEFDVFLRDRDTDTTTRLSVNEEGEEGDNTSEFARISGDGSMVSFASLAGNLTPTDSTQLRDIFVRDLVGGPMNLISVNNDGLQGNSHSSFPSLNQDGSVVVYQSLATNLVPMDGNETFDVFAWGKGGVVIPTPTSTVTRTPTNTPPSITHTPTATPPGGGLVGDVNCSGDVTSIDAVLVLQFSASLLGELECQDEADTNVDGSVDAIDATLILQLVAGFFDSLPP